MAFDLSQLFSLLGSPAPGQMVMPPVGSPAEQMPQFNGPMAQQAMPSQPQGNLAPIPQVQTLPLGQPDQAPPSAGLGMPSAAPAPQSSGLGGLLDGFHSFTGSDRGRAIGDFLTGLAMGGTPQQSLGYGAQMTAAGRTTRRATEQERAKSNQTVQWLTKRGVDPSDAALLASNPAALSAYLKDSLAPKDDRTGDIKNYQYAVQNGFKGSFTDYKKSGEAGTKYGLQPIFGQDANGNQVIGTLGNDGTFKPIDTGGVKVQSGVDKVDLGTQWGMLDKRTGQIVGYMPKDLAGAESQKAQGKAQGEAQVSLGGTLEKADQSIALIDQMLTHPGLSTATGLSGTIDPRNYIAGTDATNFSVMRKQLEGKAFLEAFSSLKGGGQITEVEGQKATEAIARLSTTQSEEEYRKALMELRGILALGKDRARAMAGGGASASSGMPATPTQMQPAAPTNGAPQPGAVMQGYRFKGGDPSQQSNWEAVQ